MLERQCVCGCGKQIPDARRLGSAYFDNKCKQRHYHHKLKLNHDLMYMKIDKNNILIAVPQEKIIDGQCLNCDGLMQINCGVASGRQIRFCPDCQTVTRRRI